MKQNDWNNRISAAQHKKAFSSIYAIREIVQLISDKGDTILDPFAGKGARMFDLLMLGRNAIGIEIDRSAASVAHRRLSDMIDLLPRVSGGVICGDSTQLAKIVRKKVDHVMISLPFLILPDDENATRDPSKTIFCNPGLMFKVFSQCKEVLKQSGKLVIIYRYCTASDSDISILNDMIAQCGKAGFQLTAKITINNASHISWRKDNITWDGADISKYTESALVFEKRRSN